MDSRVWRYVDCRDGFDPAVVCQRPPKDAKKAQELYGLCGNFICAFGFLKLSYLSLDYSMGAAFFKLDGNRFIETVIYTVIFEG